MRHVFKTFNVYNYEVEASIGIKIDTRDYEGHRCETSVKIESIFDTEKNKDVSLDDLDEDVIEEIEKELENLTELE